MFNIYMRRNSEVLYTAPEANLPAESAEILERSSIIDTQADVAQNVASPAADLDSANEASAVKPGVEYGKTANFS